MDSLLRQQITRFPRIHRRIKAHRRNRWHINDRKSYLLSELAKAREHHDMAVAQMPENVIPDGERRDIEHHAHAVWGSKMHATSLLAYRAFYGQFCEGWVPWTYYFTVLSPGWKSTEVIGSKTISRRFIPGDLIPDLAYYVRGCWTDADNRPLEAGEVADLVFADTDEVYVKTDTGGVGRGVTRHTRETFDLQAITTLGNVSVQAPVHQHAVFDAICPDSVATLRITTVKPAGEAARAPGSHLRVGFGGATVVTGPSTVEMAVMDDDGALSRHGAQDWVKVDRHPDTGVVFEGFKVPSFAAARRLCEELHDTLPHLEVIGWDVVIDRDGAPKIIEFNTKSPGFDGHQILAGAHFTGFGWEDAWKR